MQKEKNSTLAFCIPEPDRWAVAEKKCPVQGDTLLHQCPSVLRTDQVVPVHTGVGNFIPNVLV